MLRGRSEGKAFVWPAFPVSRHVPGKDPVTVFKIFHLVTKHPVVHGLPVSKHGSVARFISGIRGREYCMAVDYERTLDGPKHIPVGETPGVGNRRPCRGHGGRFYCDGSRFPFLRRGADLVLKGNHFVCPVH